MRSAIALIWISLLWTLLCLLLYRDRGLIIQASLPVWIASAGVWIVYRIVTAVLPSGWWRRRARPRARKRAASRVPSQGANARRTPRKSAAKPRKRSS